MKFILPLLLLSLGAFSGGNIQKPSQNDSFYAQKSVKRSTDSDSFLSYWREDFRKDEEGEIIPICDITYGQYKEMYGKYSVLNTEDRNVINSTPDYEQGYTISDSIKQLISMFSSNQKSQDRVTLNQTTTITIVVSIAVFGMSTICVFFVLKNNKIID